MATAATFPRMEDLNPDESRPPVLTERAAGALLARSPDEVTADQGQESFLRDSNLAQIDSLLNDPKLTNPDIRAVLQSERARVAGGDLGPGPASPAGAMPVAFAAPRMPTATRTQFPTTTPQIQALEGQQAELQKRSQTRLQTLSAERDTAAQGVQDTFKEPVQTFDQFSAGRKVPLPQYQEQPYSQENALGFGAIATAFAAIASLRTRQPLTAALTAAGSAMQGYTNGRFAQVKQDLDVYRTKFTAAIASNREMLQEYQTIITDRNTSRAEKMALWNVASARWNDEATKAMLQNGQYDRAIQALYQRLEAGNKVQLEGDKFGASLQARYDEMATKLAVAGIRKGPAPTAAADLDEPGKMALDIQAWNFLTSKTLPYRKGTGGGADRNDAVVRRAGEIAQSLNMTPEAVSAMPASWKADASSLMLQTKKVDAISAQLESFHNNLDTWNSLAQGITPQIGGERVRELGSIIHKIDFIGVQSLDDVKLRIQQQTNDPTVNAYLIAAMAAAMDYARIMSGPQSAAQLTEGARKDAEKLIRAGADNDARIGIMAALESDTEGQRKGMESQITAIRNRMMNRNAPGGAGAGASGGPKYKEGDTATGPNGSKATFRNGHWVLEQ